MSEHTNGPWSTGASYGPLGIEIIDADGHWVCGIAHVEKNVYDKDGRVTGVVPLESGLARARLIVAAPDMFSVLSELAECAEYWSEYDVPLGIVDRIRAALAKAKGEAA